MRSITLEWLWCKSSPEPIRINAWGIPEPFVRRAVSLIISPFIIIIIIIIILYYYYYYYFVICFYLLFSLWKRFLKLAASQLSFNCTLLVAFQPHIQLYTFLFIENILPLLPNLHRVYKKKYESTSFPLSNGFAHTLKTRLSIDANCTVMTVLPGRK